MTEESKHGGVTPLGSASAGGKFLTVAEVAATLRVSKMSVYRLIHSGSLEAAVPAQLRVQRRPWTTTWPARTTTPAEAVAAEVLRAG
jgi:excisionase family DNA binding protein